MNGIQCELDWSQIESGIREHFGINALNKAPSTTVGKSVALHLVGDITQNV